MSLPEFLQSVKAASGFLAPVVEVIGRGPDPDYLRDVLRRADIWLTPAAVAGFDPNDFISLTTEDRDRLTQSVEEFSAVAREVPPDRPATEEQVRRALPVFQTILSILAPYLFEPEGWEVYRALWWVRCKYPEFVLGYDYELRTDSTGDPAVVIWVVVPDDFDPTNPNYRTQEVAVRHEIARVFADRDIKRWPYVRIQTRSEARDRVATGAV
jgi:hypothetical protein